VLEAKFSHHQKYQQLEKSNSGIPVTVTVTLFISHGYCVSV